MFEPSSQELRIIKWCTSESFYDPPLARSLLRTRSDVQTTRSKSRTLFRCQDPWCYGFAIRDAEGCFPVGGRRRMADHTEGTVLRAVGAESVVVRERDGCAL